MIPKLTDMKGFNASNVGAGGGSGEELVAACYVHLSKEIILETFLSLRVKWRHSK